MPFFSARPTAIFNLRSRRKLPFLLRQILTTGYVAAGYRNTVAWRNVNSINNSTDTTTNHGDLLQNGGSYMAGAQNRNNCFIFATNGTGTEGWGGFNNTSCFNMRNNTTLAKTAAMNTPEAVGHSHSFHETDDDGNYKYAYYTGANGNTGNIIRRYNLTTEISDGSYSLATSFPNIVGSTNWSGDGSSGFQDETFGVWYNSTARVRFNFATQSQSTPSASYGAHAQQRGQGSKLGFGWAGNEGSYNAGYNFRKTNLITDTQVGTYTKPIGDSGEENFTMGQAHAYMLGMYNGQQNNRSWRWNYATDSGFEGGASMQPTGVATGTGVGGSNHPESTIQGRSSAVCYWRD